MPAIDWRGMGWLRLQLKAHPSLCNRPLWLSCHQMGASEIYLDGQRIGAFGKVGTDSQTEESLFMSYGTTRVIPIQFRENTTHVIAVRYSNFWSLNHRYQDVPAWIGLGLSELESGIAQRMALTRDVTIYQMLCVAPLAFALLHFLLFLFYPEYKRNLYYAIFALSVAIMIYTPFHTAFQTSPTELLWMHWIFKMSLILSMLSGQRFLYHIFFKTMPKF